MNDFKCESCGSDWLTWYNDLQVCGNCLQWAEHGVTQELIKEGPKVEEVAACATCGGVEFVVWGESSYCKECVRRSVQPKKTETTSITNMAYPLTLAGIEQAKKQIGYYKAIEDTSKILKIPYIAPNVYNFKSTLSDSVPPPQLGALDPDVLVAELPVTPDYLHSALNREWPW